MFKSEGFKFSRISLLVVLLTLSILLVACGPDREEATSNTESGTENDADETNGGLSEEPPKPDALNIWANDDEHQLDAIEHIAATFTEETGIDVNITPFDMFDQTEAIALDGPAGTGPDLFYQPHDRTGDIALQGLAQPVQLDDETMNRFTEEAITGLTFEGELYGVPFVSETYALLYNTELVPEAPQTMDELLDIAEELTDPGADQYGFLAEANNFYFVYPFFSGYGGYVFDVTEEGFNPDDIGLANDGAVQGGQLIQSWFENHYIPTTIDADIMNGLFVDGNVGVALTGPWSIPQYRDGIGGENLASAPLPVLESGDYASSFVGIKAWLLSAWSENEYWATELMKFMVSDEMNMHYYEVAGEMPAQDHLLQEEVIADDALMAGFAEQATRGEPMPNIPEMTPVWEPMGDALQFIADGDDVEEVLQEAVQQIEEQIFIMGN